MIRFLAAITFLACLATILGCDAQELERIRAEAESNARIAQACTPQVGQRVIAEWVMQDEQQALSFTVLEYVGQKKGTFQYVMLREEIIP